MRRRILTGAAGATLVLTLAAGSVSAREPAWGIPGDPNCEGQTTALFARVGVPGIAHSARVIGWTVKELKAGIAEFCTP